MPNDEEDIIDGQEPEVPEGDEPEGDEEPEQLIGGKFKSVDDALNAYHEAEKSMHTTSTLNSALIKQLESWGCVVDKATGLVTPPATQQPNPTPAPTGEEASQKFWDDFTADPHGTLNKYTKLGRTQEKLAAANVKRALGTLKTKALYPKIEDAIEVELAAIDDEYLVDQAQAALIVNNVYKKVLGDFVDRATPTDDTDPSARAAAARAMGFDTPAPSPATQRSTLSQSDIEMIDSLGLSGKDKEEVIKAAKERVKREAQEREGR